MKKVLIIALIIILSVIYKNKLETVIIPEEAIRFRIIANSNSKEDQNAKIIIRDKVQKQLTEDLEKVDNIENARTLLSNNTVKYEKLIDKVLNENNIKADVNVSYGLNYFPEKTYKGVKYEDGNYESLVVTLGDGIGKNWWCVLFPPLCLLEAEEEQQQEKVEYKFFVKELIDKYFK